MTNDSQVIPLSQLERTEEDASWRPTDHGVTITWRDVSIYAKIPNTSLLSRGSGTYKRIINNVTGAVQPGTLVAVMGPSGAGKSTLMGALSYRNTRLKIIEVIVMVLPYKIHEDRGRQKCNPEYWITNNDEIFYDGDIRINGRVIDKFVHKISGFMHQEDLFVSTLTVREHLNFMARMRLDRKMTRGEMNKLVQDILTQLGLQSCAENRIGGDGSKKVISGGEKKRLSFATEMLTNPPLLFCDEPTTGLDSYSAQKLLHLMKLMTSQGKTVVCTIHQPSSELFDMFNQLILMADGRIAFVGDKKSALKFFKDQGFPCPDSYNPADYYMKILSTTQNDSRSVIKRICNEFAASEDARQVEQLIDHHSKVDTSQDIVDLQTSWKETLWINKLLLLSYRSFLQVIRDPSVQAVRILQKLAIAFMVGLCYLGTVDTTQTGVQSVQGAVFVFVTENTFPAMYSILALFPEELPLFMREYKNSMYSTPLYYMSKMISLTPGLILEPTLFTMLAYWLIGLRSSTYAYLMTTLVTILTMNVATACGCFFSNAFDNVPIAMAWLIPFDYVLMITSGLFIKLDSMPDIIGWFKYLSWFMYSNEAMSILQWEGIDHISCEYNNTDIPCLRDGTQVLEKYDFSVSHFHIDLLAMLTMFVGFHVLGYFCLWWKASSHK